MNKIDLKKQPIQLYLMDYHKNYSVILLDSSFVLRCLIKGTDTGQKNIINQLSASNKAVILPDFIYHEAHIRMISMGYKPEFNEWVNDRDFVFLLENNPYSHVTKTTSLESIIRKAPQLYQEVLSKHVSFTGMGSCDLALICYGLNLSDSDLIATILTEDMKHMGKGIQNSIREIANSSNNKKPLRIRYSKTFTV